MNFPGATWISSHVYGDSSCNHFNRMFYVNIPKCASMWMREYVALLGTTPEYTWLSCNFSKDNLDAYVPIILLRDPVKRWASNCPAPGYVLEFSKDMKALDNIFKDFKDWMKDEHSSPQTDFITGLNLERAVFFYCDKNLSKNVEHYLRSVGFNVSAPSPTNERPKEYDEPSQAWEEILSIPKYFQIFKQHFQEDYNLINSVNFYRDGE